MLHDASLLGPFWREVSFHLKLDSFTLVGNAGEVLRSSPWPEALLFTHVHTFSSIALTVD